MQGDPHCQHWWTTPRGAAIPNDYLGPCWPTTSKPNTQCGLCGMRWDDAHEIIPDKESPDD